MELKCNAFNSVSPAARLCPLLAKAPKHGRMNCSHPHSLFGFGSRCEFKCSEGFSLRGQPATTCNSSSRWSDDVPTCQRERNKTIMTQPLSLSLLVLIQTANLASYRVAAVRCEPIRALSPPLSMTCSQPLGNFSFGSECRFACKEGFSLNGSKLLLCSSTGTWSGRRPVCSGKSDFTLTVNLCQYWRSAEFRFSFQTRPCRSGPPWSCTRLRAGPLLPCCSPCWECACCVRHGLGKEVRPALTRCSTSRHALFLCHRTPRDT